MNIPSVKVNCYSNDQNLQARFLCLRQDIKSKNVQIIDLIGDCQQPLNCGECEFNSLRFPCTSYTYKGSRFFLGVCLINIKNDRVASDFMVSPSIYIESRKKAHLERQTYDSLFQVFTPSQLEKEIVFPPQDEKLSKLYNFLTTPKIRLKIFNPLYLTLKFPETLQLYVNTYLLKEEKLDIGINENIFIDLFGAIDKNLNRYKNKKYNCKMNEKLFVMTVQKTDKNNEEVQKIMKLLNTLEGCVITILSSDTVVPKNFKFLELQQKLQQGDDKSNLFNN